MPVIVDALLGRVRQIIRSGGFEPEDVKLLGAVFDASWHQLQGYYLAEGAERDAETAGTLNGQTWNEFRKTECAGGATAADQKAATSNPKYPSKPAAATTVTGAVFPKAIDPKYAKKSAGKARFYTCLDQYRANKSANGNGGLKWIQKGGGYYSLCNSSLKG